MKIITALITTGFDWHDMSDHKEYLKEDASLDIKNPIRIIAQDMYERIRKYNENHEHPVLTEENIPTVASLISILESRTKYETSNEFYGLEVYYNKEQDAYTIDFWEQCTYTVSYYITIIDDENIMYVPIEEFLAPWKGAYTVEKAYVTDGFDTYEEAEKHIIKAPVQTYCSRRNYVAIMDRKIMADNIWWTRQKEIVNSAKEKGIDLFDEKVWAIDGLRHLENIKKA